MSIFGTLADKQANREAVVLCTIVNSQGSTPRRVGSKMLVYPDGSISGTIGGGEMESRVIASALQALQDRKARMLSYSFSDPTRGDPGVCGGQMEVFVEPILPPVTILVIGVGHVGKAVAHLAHWLGYQVAVSDDRPEFCTPEAVPEADDYYPVQLSRLTDEMVINPWTYVVLTTRGVDVDLAGLPALLDTPAAYIGVIGSRRRWALAHKKLVEAGVPEQKLERIHSPIGLELNAETPEEIAVSIMAEIIMMERGGHGRPMSAVDAHKS